jgi:DNA-binding NtrC family response regulator
VRELLVELAGGVEEALRERAASVEARHLPPESGSRALPVEPAPEASEAELIRTTLQQERGNVSRAARALGMHRAQLRRRLKRYGIDPKNLA